MRWIRLPFLLARVVSNAALCEILARLSPVHYDIGKPAEASLARQVEVRHVDKLKQAIVLEWRALPQRRIDHSIGNWRRRPPCVMD